MGGLVVVGGSWGGTDAAAEVLRALPEDFPLPIVVALHRAPGRYANGLSRFLSDRCSLGVHEASDKDDLRGGCVFVAPADYHVIVEQSWLSLSVDPPVRSSRPSIDVLFETAADSYGAGVVAVVLTGANADGAEGAKRVVQAGGRCLVQDPREAARPEMPTAAIEATVNHEVLPLAEIGPRLVALSGEQHVRR